MASQFSRKERIVQTVLILIAIATCFTIAFALNSVGKHSSRKKMLDSMGACYFSSLQSDKSPTTARETLASTLGPQLMAGYACLSDALDPAAGDIVMIERPTAFPGDWVFAVYGDALVRTVGRDEAIELVHNSDEKTKSHITAPKPP